MTRVIIFLLLGVLAFAQDAELFNRRSGISLTWGVGDGSDKGVAYMEEYLYYDKTVSDRKVVYIRDDTAITATHNAANNVAYHVGSTPTGYFRVIGANGLDGVPNSGDEGTVRYRVDREGARYLFEWTNYGGNTPWPALTTTTFAAMTYIGTTDPVVGTNGIVAGTQRGIVDDTGDEWHVIAVGDDDRSFETEALGVKSELQASDGKIYTFVVNPKTPGMTVRATGDGQFYTTPPKAYLVPKIHRQTTYFTVGSGNVSFELRDLYGRNIEYRVTAGTTGSGLWTTVGASTFTLNASDFSTGSNVLEYRSAGFESNAKTRLVVKNPTHPSLAENHGHYLWGDQTELNKITARLTRVPYSNGWTYLQHNDNTNLTLWDAHGTSADRNPFYEPTYLYRVPLPTPAQNTAFVGLVLGFDVVPAGKTLSWGAYAKQMLLHNLLARVDPVDFERNQSNGSNPAVEILGAGYYQVGHMYSLVTAYDIIAGHYRSDQNANGLTPIEDYFIRDIIAGTVQLSAYDLVVSGIGSAVGLWPGARIVGATMGAQCLKEYSTPYYGTSGYGTVQTPYAWTPHPVFSPTWKEVFATTPAISATIPGTDKPSWTMDDPALWQPGGIWGGPNLGYFSLMNRTFQILQNINARYSPTTAFPHLAAGQANAVAGTLTTIDNDPPSYQAQPLLANTYHGSLGVAAASAIKSRSAEVTDIRDYRLLGLIWYDDTLGSASDVTAPTVTSTVIPSAGDTVVITFSEPVNFGAGSSGGWSLSLSGGAATATYSAGTGTGALTYSLSRTVALGETGTRTYTQPGNGIEDLAGNDLANVSSGPIIIGSGDGTLPTVLITGPTSGPTYATSSPTIALSGTAADNVAVLNVIWSNNRGGSGAATGTTSWSVAIPLQSGENILTVQSRDTNDNLSVADTLTVTYTPPAGGTTAVRIHPARRLKRD